MSVDSKIVACDVGLKRIGLAALIQGVVLPLTPIARRNRNQTAQEVSALLRAREAEIVLIGLPSGGVAGYEDTRRRIEHFASLLEFGGEIIFVNEDYTSLEALESLSHITRGKREKARRDGRLDSLSACKILERYLEG